MRTRPSLPHRVCGQRCSAQSVRSAARLRARAWGFCAAAPGTRADSGCAQTRFGGESGLTECHGKAGLHRLASRRLGVRDVWHILVSPCAAARAAQQLAASVWALAEPVRAGRAGDKSVPVAVAALCASDGRPKHARSSLDAEQGEYILELECAAAAASLATAEALAGGALPERIWQRQPAWRTTTCTPSRRVPGCCRRANA